MARNTHAHREKLDAKLDGYLRNWGPLQWRGPLSVATPPPNQQIARALLCLGAIETDSLVIYRKVHLAGVDLDPAVRQFVLCWLGEEAEHGRALTALAQLLGASAPPPTRSDRSAHIREIVAWPVLVAARPFKTLLQATYCALGAVQEYIALTTYRYCARLLGDPHLAEILDGMALQESRHMRFYRYAASVFLESTAAQRITRRALRRLWRPPGVDVLGIDHWLETFRCLLVDEEYRARLVGVDSMIQHLPGLDGLVLMERFLSGNGYSIPHHPEIQQALDAADAD